MTFDTLAVATELKAAGFPPEQAEALARAWSHVASGDLATKSDLVGVEAALKQDIAAVRTEMKQDIAAVRTEMKQDIAAVRTEMMQIKSDLEKQISGVKSDLEKKIDAVHSDNVLLKWMIGFTLGLSLLILGKLFAVHS
ncbi:MAG: coiled-coil domain-containing protein [Leptospirales bacterium]